VASSDLIPSDRDRPEPASLEVEFALVLARMIDSLKNNPEDMRQAIYELARHKLQEQFPDVSAEEKDRTQQALETAIRGVEAFTEQRDGVVAPTRQLQLNSPRSAPTARNLVASELVPHVEPRSPLNVVAERDARGSKQTDTRWSHLRRAAALIAVLVAVLAAVQQRERLLSLVHILPKPEQKATIEERIAPLQAGNHATSALPPATPAPLRPTDYGVYAVGDDAVIGLSLLPGRPPDIRVGVSAAIMAPSRTILTNGHPKFIVFRRDITSIADGAEVRIVAKIEHEFSTGVISAKPDSDAWVMRNISFPFRVSPVNDNPEMLELHSEDTSLELTPGRYALVLKTQAYDFSVGGAPTDPRQCIERIVSTNGTFYSDCKKP
jgi:hypothetical protein